MNRLAFACLIGSGAVFLSAWLPAADPQVWSEAETESLRQFLASNFAESPGGMVIGLVDENGTQFFSAGKVGDGSGRKVDERTIFEIGSVTKTFTSLLLLEMARRGEVKLEDPAEKFLPDGVTVPKFEGKEITLLNLSAQDSGLPFNPDNFKHEDPKTAFETFRANDLYEFLANYELTIAPGEEFQYSNIGMTLLAHALELHTGKDYESLVKERVCDPLGMKDTLMTLRPELESRAAPGHDDKGEPIPWLDLKTQAGAGALRSTVSDMLIYVSANLGFVDTDLAPLIREMQVQRHTGPLPFGNTAMPWVDENLYQPPGSAFMGHSGGTFGSRAFAGFDTKKKRGVVVLSNQLEIRSAAIGWKLLQGMPITRESIEMQVREIVGIGTALQPDEETGFLRIIRIFPESPAGKAGVKVGTLIREIDGKSVKGEEMKDCLAMLGGAEGSVVQLRIIGPEEETPKTVDLTRRKFLSVIR